jgi:membrane associated rhomboid family serine protease
MAVNNLTYQYKTANIVVKLIVINTAIFLLVSLSSFLFNISQEQLAQWFFLPEEFSNIITQPWSLFTYAFLHFSFWHLFFNMIVLYWFGPFVLNIFSAKRFLTIYLLGALFGGLLYILAYNLFPVFTGQRGYLIGASAGVRAIMIFIAAYAPNTQLRIFTFNIKLWHIGVFVVLLDLIQIPTSANAGGLLAHLGGALFGYLYAIQLTKGKDLGKWFENLLDWLENFFKPRKKKPFRKVHRTTQGTSQRSKIKENKTENQKKVDAILDKIGKSGYDSLTKAEKDFLFKAGKED